MENTEEIWGEKLKRVLAVKNGDFVPHLNETLFDEIVFIFESAQIKIISLIDTDELKIELSEIDKEKFDGSLTDLSILKNYTGKKISQTWKCFNAKGYFDLFILGFQYLHPNLMVLSEGGLKIFQTDELKNQKAPKK